MVAYLNQKHNMENLSIIIPLYNEEKVAKNTLEEVYAYCTKNPNIKSFEIICIDDGSKDGTRTILELMAKTHPEFKLTKKRENKGKGYSIKEGVIMASNDLIFFFDADLATPLLEIENFLKNKENIDIVIGSRNSKGSKVERSTVRNIISKSFVIVTNLICGFKHSDTQCGFKLLKRDVAKDIFTALTMDGFAFDVEMLMIAKIRGYSAKEIPISWKESKQTTVDVPYHSIHMLRDVIKIRMNKKAGIYNRSNN